MDKRENVCSATCPVIVLSDDKEIRVFLPELSGSCSATFLPVVDMGNYPQSEIPSLGQGNGRCRAIDNIIHAALTTLFTERISTEKNQPHTMRVQPGSQGVIRKFQFHMKSQYK